TFCWTNTNCLIGETRVQAVAIGFGVHRDRANAQLFGRADHAQGDLAAVGYQDFPEHSRLGAHRGRIENSASPYSTGRPFSTSLAVMMPATSASISFISFIDSMMHSTWPGSTASPTRTKDGAPGAAAS